jgi:hypothetical protein
MGRFIIEADPDVDLYCEWSSIVEAPTWIGSRSELVGYLAEHSFDGSGDCKAMRPEDIEERLARVDETGTSIAFRIGPHAEGSWGDTGLIYQQQGVLPRNRLAEFLQRFLDNRPADVDVSDLLDPFED